MNMREIIGSIVTGLVVGFANAGVRFYFYLIFIDL